MQGGRSIEGAMGLSKPVPIPTPTPKAAPARTTSPSASVEARGNAGECSQQTDYGEQGLLLAVQQNVGSMVLAYRNYSALFK